MAAYCCTSLPVGELLQFGTLKGVGIAVTEDVKGAVVDYLFAGKVIGWEVIEVGFGFLFVLRNDGEVSRNVQLENGGKGTKIIANNEKAP